MRREETGLFRIHIVMLFMMMVIYALGGIEIERFKTALLAYIAAMVAAIYFKIQPHEKENADAGKKDCHASSGH